MVLLQHGCTEDLTGGGVLGHGLGTLGHGVLGQFSWEEKANSSLDLAAADGAASVGASQAGSLSGDPPEDIVNEAVHHRHSTAGDASVGVDLLQHFVDVDAVALSATAATPDDIPTTTSSLSSSLCSLATTLGASLATRATSARATLPRASLGRTSWHCCG